MKINTQHKVNKKIDDFQKRKDHQFYLADNTIKSIKDCFKQIDGFLSEPNQHIVVSSLAFIHYLHLEYRVTRWLNGKIESVLHKDPFESVDIASFHMILPHLFHDMAVMEFFGHMSKLPVLGDVPFWTLQKFSTRDEVIEYLS